MAEYRLVSADDEPSRDPSAFVLEAWCAACGKYCACDLWRCCAGDAVGAFHDDGGVIIAVADGINDGDDDDDGGGGGGGGGGGDDDDGDDDGGGNDDGHGHGHEDDDDDDGGGDDDGGHGHGDDNDDADVDEEDNEDADCDDDDDDDGHGHGDDDMTAAHRLHFLLPSTCCLCFFLWSVFACCSPEGEDAQRLPDTEWLELDRRSGVAFKVVLRNLSPDLSTLRMHLYTSPRAKQSHCTRSNAVIASSGK